ncbi:MAG: CDP-diacylglycerol--glycerol-3-phosphate 3-phosphatidyltransferase [Pseudomonadota bacterium]
MNLANKITLARVLMIPVFLVLMLVEFPYHMTWALAVFALASLTDHLDGHIARKYNMITDFGKFMDPLADKLLVTAAFVVFVQLGKIDAWIVFVILAREFAVTGLRSLAAAQDVIIAASYFGKVKTVTQITAIIILLMGNYPFSLVNFPMDTVMVYAALIATIASGVDYFIKNKHVVMQMK